MNRKTSNYGEVKQVNVIEGKGFGFVEMSSPSAARRAKERLSNFEFKGRILRVEEAHTSFETGRHRFSTDERPRAPKARTGWGTR